MSIMNEPNIVIVCEPLLGEKDCNLHSLTKQYSFETKLYVKDIVECLSETDCYKQLSYKQKRDISVKKMSEFFSKDMAYNYNIPEKRISGWELKEQDNTHIYHHSNLF